MAELLRVITSFDVTSRADGMPRTFSTGMPVWSNDCDVKGREEFFEPMAIAAARMARGADSDSETASAAPGERRFRSKPAASAADSKPSTTSKESGS
jgi:hypothetical protein